MQKIEYFAFNHRLGIPLPDFSQAWESYSPEQQQQILLEWELIRGRIPDRIKQLEIQINGKQEQLNREENFERSCSLNSEIADLASVINDLWLHYRTHQDVTNHLPSDHKGHQ